MTTVNDEEIGNLENELGFVTAEIEECEDRLSALREQKIALESELAAMSAERQNLNRHAVLVCCTFPPEILSFKIACPSKSRSYCMNTLPDATKH